MPDTPRGRRWRTWLERFDFDRAVGFAEPTAAGLTIRFDAESRRGFDAARKLALYSPVIFFLCVPLLHTSTLFLVLLLLLLNPIWGSISKRV